jgi:hypothetical protein
MISPHLCMTAAHCGGPDNAHRVVMFFHIDPLGPVGPQSQQLSEGYNAVSLPWQLFVEQSGERSSQISDFMLWWVESGSDGVPPGIKYGIFELSAAPTQLDESVYSFWRNPVDDLRLADTLLYSSGKVVGHGTGQPGDPPTNFTIYSLPTTGGASGSTVIGAGTRHNRRAVGVTAVGDNQRRVAADTRFVIGRRDDTQNSVIDVVEEDFVATGLRLPFQRLRLRTPLERALWRLEPGTRSRIGDATVLMEGEDRDAAWHSVARFAGNRRYRISILLRPLGQPTADSAVYVKLRSDRAAAERIWQVRPIMANWWRYNGAITLPPGDDYRPVVKAEGPGTYELDELSIIADDYVQRFNTLYERDTWEFSRDSFITSRSTRGGFAGVVAGPNLERSWGLRNRHLALEREKQYQVSFQAVKLRGRSDTEARVRLQDLENTIAFDHRFPLPQQGVAVSKSIVATTRDLPAAALTFSATGDLVYEIHDLAVTEA